MFSVVVDNGVYGSGFADLVKMYGGRPVVMALDWRLPADPAAVDRWLEKERRGGGHPRALRHAVCALQPAEGVSQGGG